MINYRNVVANKHTTIRFIYIVCKLALGILLKGLAKSSEGELLSLFEQAGS